ncbi:MAG TPA: hypothetical protein VFS34_16920 [Thermoanaerobaculia bacterium]|nr:hypothetical protein [Thermoanaerobaculia bacterium]
MKKEMRLPEPLYRAVKPLFASHERWHAARLPGSSSLRGPGTDFPGLRALDEPGSGEQFLAYHRQMLRRFLEVAAGETRSGFALDRWEHFPAWLADIFAWSHPGFLPGALLRASEIVRSGSVDDLGNFLESTLVSGDPYRGLHNIAHAKIALYEEHRFGAAHPALRDARMDSPASSPHNEHFWSLHAWIDALYSERLARTGETTEDDPARSEVMSRRPARGPAAEG